MKEIWKYINGFNSQYMISNHGRVKSVYRKWINGPTLTTITKDRILKQVAGSKHSPYMGIVMGNSKKRYYIHRLVAIAFISNPHNKEQVNHKDGDKFNNHYSNLEWATHQENTKHAIDNNLRLCGEKMYNAKLTGTIVREIRSSNDSGVSLAKRYNVTTSVIFCARHRKTWKHIHP